MTNLKMRLLVSAAFCTLAAVSAHAQEASHQSRAEEDSQVGVTDIVVTAQKREQSLQDVPVSVTALTPDTITANRITSVKDLGAVVPNLTVRTQAGGSSLPIYTIRGLIAQGSAVGSDKGIALYVDGVYMGASAGSIFDLAEIERIEVLRGPQGTLFGRNSTGGAIQLITPDPKSERSFKQTLTVGNYNQLRTVSQLESGDIGPLRVSLTYSHAERRGDMRNLGAGTRWDFTAANGGKATTFVSPKWLGGNNNESVLAKARLEVNSDFDLIYRFDYTESEYTAPGLGTLYAQPVVRAIIAAQPASAQLGGISRTRSTVNNANLPSFLKNWGHSLTARYQMSDALQFKDILSYRKLRVTSPLSQFDSLGGLINTGAPIFSSLLGPALAASTVGSPFVVVPITGQTSEKQWSNELQINVTTDPLTLTTGGIYYRQDPERGGYGEEAGIGTARGGQFLVYPGNAVPYAGQPAGTRGRNTSVRVESYAFYASGEFHIAKNLDVTAGARYTHDSKSGVDYQTFSGTNSTSFPISYSKGKVTWDAGVNFRPSDDILLYAKYSTGYISGGSLGGTCTAGVCSPIVYQPETAQSWEGGIKAELFDRILRANLAVFTVKYGNLQFPVSGRALGIDPALTQVLINAGDARAKGFELETTLVPARGLTFSGGLGYTDFKFLSLTSVITAANIEQLIQYRPKWTANLAAQYQSQPLFDDVKLSARIDGSYRSEQQALSGVFRNITSVPGVPAFDTDAERAAYKEAGRIPGYWLVNGRIALDGFRIGAAEASVALWGRNLFDYDGPSYIISNSLTVAADYERARTYGVDLTFRF